MKIILCHTYYQLILSIQLKLTLFENEPVQLYLADTAGTNAVKIITNLKSQKIFEECRLVEVKQFVKDKCFLEKVSDLGGMIFGRKKYFEDFSAPDEIIFHNQNVIAYFLFAQAYELNPNVAVSRIEEGLMSYSMGDEPFFKSIISGNIRRVIGKKTLQDRYDKYYCVLPQLYDGRLKPVQIPQLKREDKNLTQLLATIFELDIKEVSKNYPEKYIFFSSIFDQGETSIREDKLIFKIKNKVKKENLKVKVHPRADTEKYRKLDVKIDRYSGIPWEVIQLCADFSDKVFLTVASGSVLSLNCFMKNPPKTILLCDECDISCNQEAVKIVSKLKKIVYGPLYKDRFFYVTSEKKAKEWLQE